MGFDTIEVNQAQIVTQELIYLSTRVICRWGVQDKTCRQDARGPLPNILGGVGQEGH